MNTADNFIDKEGPFTEWWAPEEVSIVNGCLVFKEGYKPYSIEDRYEKYVMSKKDDERFRPPYVALHDAVEELRKIPEDIEAAIKDYHFSEDCKVIEALYERKIFDPIIDWVKEFGPLGILPHECRNIVQKPSQIKVEDSNYWAAPVDFWLPEEGWQRIWIENKDEPAENLFDGISADISALGNSSIDHANNCLKTYRRGIEQGGYFNDFFNRMNLKINNEKRLPVPLSIEFINLYEEPIIFFIQGAFQLCDAINMVLSDNEIDVQEGQKELLYISSPATLIPQKGYRGGQFRMTFRAPSLLSALASWVYLDTVKIGPNGQTKAFFCQKCGKLHASSITRMKFCNVKCKNLYAKTKKKG